MEESQSQLKTQPPSPQKSSRLTRATMLGIALAGLAIGGLVVARMNHSPVATRAQRVGVTLDASARTQSRATLEDCLALLKQNSSGHPELVKEVAALVNNNSPNGPVSPSLMVVSYRERDGQAEDVVVQVYETPEAGAPTVLNPDGVVRARLGDELFGSAEQLMQLLYHPVRYMGGAEEVERQQRAFQAAMEGDLTLLREQTVEPLHVVAVMPSAENFLPGSLRDRVQSVVLDSELSFGEWRSKVALVTDNQQTAQQVGNTIAAWKEIAGSLAGKFAGSSAGKPLRDSLEASVIEVANNRVTATAAVPSRTVVRVTKEVAGHGGQRGCSPGYYKTPSHWPPSVTQLTLGCVTYTKSQCITLLTTPIGGDASLNLAQKLIAAKLNVVVGLPATVAELQAIANADTILCGYTGSLPYNVPSNSPAGQQMLALAGILDVYDNSCHTGGSSGGGSDSGGGGGGNGNTKGNNGIGNGIDPQPPGNPPVNDGTGTSPGDPGNTKGKKS